MYSYKKKGTLPQTDIAGHLQSWQDCHICFTDRRMRTESFLKTLQSQNNSSHCDFKSAAHFEESLTKLFKAQGKLWLCNPSSPLRWPLADSLPLDARSTWLPTHHLRHALPVVFLQTYCSLSRNNQLLRPDSEIRGLISMAWRKRVNNISFFFCQLCV